MSPVRTVTLAGLLSAATMVVGQASASTDAGRFVRCSWVVSDGYPYRSQGTQVGPVTCGKPLGKGRYHGKYKDTANPPMAAETTAVKLSLKAGTVRGRYRLSGDLVTGKYHGVLTVTGGTRRFRHATGTMQLSCSTAIPVVSCRASGSLAGI